MTPHVTCANNDININDLFVAASAGAYRKFMQTRGFDPDTGPLVTAIPVSKRPPLEEDDMIGNKTTTDYLAMPVHLSDAEARLKAAAHAPKACMRLALLGSVSPIALARHVLEAADSDERTPTAIGFQLVEILGCLDAARGYDASPLFQDDWLMLVNEAAAKVAAMLEKLQSRFPDDLSRDFRRYAKTVQKHHLAGKR